LIIVADSEDDLLLDLPAKKPRLAQKERNGIEEETEDVSEVIKQKHEQRKVTRKSNAVTKADRRRIKQEKMNKIQKMQSLRNVMSGELVKKDKAPKDNKGSKIKEDPDETPAKKTFNQEGKLFFSKVQLEGEKKKKKKGQDTNPQNNLLKIKSQKSKIKGLIASGDKEKAKEEKQKMLWQSAFDKTEGIKVKDNEEILKKTIKKRKNIKKKSKEKWGERKQKLDEKQSQKQKKREENLNKRKTDRKKTKLKNAAKKGRVF
jgi:Surfeit locus protein 6